MGTFAAVLCAVLSSAKDIISKRLASHLDGTTSTFASFAFAIPYYLLVLAILACFGYETITLAGTFFGLVLLRALSDSMAEGCKMHAFGHGDISVVATFFSISPLFMLIIAPMLTGDQTTLHGAVAVAVVVLGSVLLVYHPSARGWAEQKKGILLAIAAAFFFSLNSCFDRLAVKKGTPVFAGFSMTLVSALFLLPWVFLRRDRLTAMRVHQKELWMRGFLEIAFMVTKLYALQFLPPAYVAGMQRISLVLSILSGRLIFKEPDFGRRLAAGILIL